MSVRVNLLPETASVRQTAARERARYLAAGGVLVVGLVAGSLWQAGRANDADARLADEEALLASLTGEQGELGEFADLERRATEAEEQVIAALGAEASLAAILQDVASAIPADIELETLTIALDGTPAPAPAPIPPVDAPTTDAPDAGDTDGDVPDPDATVPDAGASPDAGANPGAPTPVPEVSLGAAGTLTAVGHTLNAHGPSIEGLLREFDAVAAFRDVFLSNSILEDPELPYATFTVEAELGPEVRTGRYLDGLPEGGR